MGKQRKFAYIALLVNALIWGAALPIVKPIFAYVTPTQFLYLRYVVAGICGLPFLIYYLSKKRYSLKTWLSIIGLEFIGTPIALILLYQGVARTSAIESSLLGAVSPLFTVLGGMIFLHETESRREWQGLTLSLVGTLILIVEPLFASAGPSNTSLTGNLLVIGYDIAWTVYLVIAKRLYRKLPKLFVTCVGYIVSAVAFAIMIMASNTPTPLTLLANPAVAFPVFYMAILGSLVALALYMYGQNVISVSDASIMSYLNGVIAIPIAFLYLGEKPSLVAVLATLFILWGVFRAEIRRS